MNYLFFVALLTAVCFIHRSLSQRCPSVYLRYSKNHSYCKPKNTRCPIYHSGVRSDEILQILDIHNKYRSYVATGKERHGGVLPQASDMIQMVWDKELAAVAQRTAEQCIYEHDCNDCRRVENFNVGQNIAYLEKQCTGQCPLNNVPDWKYVLKMFYDEVSIFDKRFVGSMKFFPGKEYGHFTQIVWSKTWRVGCGFVAFRKGSGYRHLYFCNYGPGGNILNMPMYKIGRSCSACPINSCCGSSCPRPGYDGLCQMNNNNVAPVYRPDGNYIFYCDFRSSTGDCSTSVVGSNKWRNVRALGGSFSEIVLNGGETSTITFKNIIRPKQAFCLVVTYRTGPAVDGQRSSNKFVADFEMTNAFPSKMVLPKSSSKEYFTYSISLNWSYDTKVSFTFSVPPGVPPQFLNIQLVAAKIGIC